MIMQNILYTYNLTAVLSLLSFCLDNISTILITFSVIITVALPTVFLSGGARKAFYDGVKWVGAGAAFGAGEYGVNRVLDSLTGSSSNSGNSSGGGSNSGNSSGGGSSSK